MTTALAIQFIKKLPESAPPFEPPRHVAREQVAKPCLLTELVRENLYPVDRSNDEWQATHGGGNCCLNDLKRPKVACWCEPAAALPARALQRSDFALSPTPIVFHQLDVGRNGNDLVLAKKLGED